VCPAVLIAALASMTRRVAGLGRKRVELVRTLRGGYGRMMWTFGVVVGEETVVRDLSVET